MLKPPIYLDYNSTTPVDQRVLEEMLPYFSQKFGNASSKTHAFGWIAEDAVQTGRKRAAQLINCLEQELIFTSGATEGVNLAIKGVFEAYKAKGNHIVTVCTEHKAVLDACKSLEKKGGEVTYLGVNKKGLIDLKELEKAITEKTVLVSIMYANNETGVIQPMQQISEIVHQKGCIFMSDATQAAGKIPVDIVGDGIDLLAFSAHKLYGSKGVGALYIRRKGPRVILNPQMDGGGHERGLRAGTLNVPGIVGLGMACELAGENLKMEAKSIACLRDELQAGMEKIGGAIINGDQENRLPNTCNVSFEGINAESLIMKAREIAVSTGSACTSALKAPSHVLQAMGIGDELAYASIRFSLGRFTTLQEVEKTIKVFQKIVPELKRSF